VGKRELDRARTGSLIGLAVAVVAAAAGLLGWPVFAWVLAAGALAVLGLTGTALRPPAVPPEPPPDPVRPPDEPSPDIARIEELSTAVEHLESAIRVLRERAAGPGADEQLDECDRRMAGSVEMINAFATSVTDASGRLDTLRSVMFQIMGQISEMSDISDRISKMVDTIRKIASQTNLLALNATIEAARAGEAGKGFAVVADEVKQLAQQTARATGEIGQRIEAIQGDAGGAVAAIGEIASIISRINDFQTTIASAVEEQTATTNEMSQNVSVAAQNSEQVSANIGGVARAATTTTGGVRDAQRAAAELASMSANLQKVVDRFRL
jgi:methyl-accepting chemotaxis protein